MPVGASLGSSATDFFCGAVERGSSLLTKAVNNPGRVFLALGLLMVLLLWLASRTRWNVSSPFRLARRRPWGSIASSAFRLYWTRRRLFLGIGLGFLPLGVLITALQYWLFRHGPFTSLVEAEGPSNAFVAAAALTVGIFFTILGLTVVQAVIALAMVELDEGREITAFGAYKLALPRIRVLLGSLVRAAVVIAVLDLFVAGVVIGIWLLFRWVLLPQVVVLDGRRAHPLRRSAELVRGHWWLVASITTVVTGGALALGPLVGTLLLVVTSASFDVVNLVSALIYAVTLPLAAITQTYLYFHLEVEEKLAPAEVAPAAVLPAEL